MTPQKIIKLKKALEETHEQFVLNNEVQNDAIAPALRYSEFRDQEFAAFICAVLAYGKVSHIITSTKKILDPMGDHPVSWLCDADQDSLIQLTKSWKHRFNTGKDMLLLLNLLRQVYSSHKSLEEFLSISHKEDAEKIITRLHDRLRSLKPVPYKAFPKKGASFWFFLAHPKTGSACKRLNLFLRWMAGQTEMDLGLWRSVSRSQLLIPVDTHVLNQARRLNLTKRKTADWKTAVEITNKLRLLDPEDPTRFDFALCHIGIRGELLEL